MRRKYILLGQVRGGKNAIRTTKEGRRYPSKVFARWAQDAINQIREQDTIKNTITIPLGISLDYIPGDNRIRDIPAILDAVFHALEGAEIVESDGQFRRIGHYCQHPPNRDQPMVIVELFSY